MISLIPLHEYLGTVCGTLRIVSMAGRDPTGSPVWSCECLRCDTKGIRLEHRRIALGNARCTSSLCDKRAVAPGASSIAQAGAAQITGSARQRRELVTGREPERNVTLHPLVVAELARRDAIRDKQRQQDLERWQAEQREIDEDYRKYKRHAVLEWGLTPENLISRSTFELMGRDGRAKVLGRISEETNDI